MVIRKTLVGELCPSRSVGAVDGMEAAQGSVRAMMQGGHAGKVVVFPQVSGVPSTGASAVRETPAAVARPLGPGRVRTYEAEQALIEGWWKP